MKPFPLNVPKQPDETTCGPTCLWALYQYYGDELPLDQVVDEVVSLETGGSLAVALGCHALSRGYSARVYTYNLQVIDLTWLDNPNIDVADRLRRQADLKRDPKLRRVTELYLQYLELGGELTTAELNGELLTKYLVKGRPILTGLSATYLYHTSREDPDAPWDYDDIGGYPAGHFVVLSGYDPEKGEVLVADPLHDNPRFGAAEYHVHVDRVIGSILLGVLTYDGNLLVLEPPTDRRPRT